MASGLKFLITDKPVVPQYERVDFGKESADALAENQANLPAAAAFAEEFNRLSGDQLNAALERMLPGYGNLRDTSTANIQSLLRGELPSDVENLIERRAAERGITMGTSGSDFNEFGAVRQLGLTSLEMTQRGLDSAMRWIDSVARRTPTFNMASAFVPIGQRVGIKAAENQFKFQTDWLRNQIKAVPWGWKAEAINVADFAASIGDTVVGAYAGGGFGGAGGGGGGVGGTKNTTGGGWGGVSGGNTSGGGGEDWGGGRTWQQFFDEEF